jgi:hypothetical protein
VHKRLLEKLRARLAEWCVGNGCVLLIGLGDYCSEQLLACVGKSTMLSLTSS